MHSGTFTILLAHQLQVFQICRRLLVFGNQQQQKVLLDMDDGIIITDQRTPTLVDVHNYLRMPYSIRNAAYVASAASSHLA